MLEDGVGCGNERERRRVRCGISSEEGFGFSTRYLGSLSRLWSMGGISLTDTTAPYRMPRPKRRQFSAPFLAYVSINSLAFNSKFR